MSGLRGFINPQSPICNRMRTGNELRVEWQKKGPIRPDSAIKVKAGSKGLASQLVREIH